MLPIRIVWRALLSFWMILVLLTVGWGPLFIAEFVRTARPDLNARYAPQAFAMGWMPITLSCSFLAVVYAVGHSIRLIFRLGK